MSARSGFAGSVLAVVLASTTLARGQAPGPPGDVSTEAQGLSARLEWHAPAGCPERAEVLARVATLAESDRLSGDRFQSIRGAIVRRGSRWTLELEFVGRGGVSRRSLESGSCNDLAEAAAVAVVLAQRSGEVDAARAGPTLPEPVRERPLPEATQEAPAAGVASLRIAPTPARGAPTESVASDAGEPAGAGAQPSAQPADVTLAASLEAMVDPSTLGSAAFGAAVGVELGVGTFSTDLYAAGFPAVTTSLGVGQAIELGLWTGGLRGCLRWGRGLDTCALMELGELTARGVGLSEPRQSQDVWAAPGLSAGFRATPFDGFGLTARVSALHPLVRGQYRVDETDVVHRIPAFSVRAALGIDLPFL